MLRINPIKNVNNTLNHISFKAGVQTNYGLNAPASSKNMVEGGLLTGFVGTIVPLFTQVQSRAKSIEKGLDETKLNYYI